MQLKGWGGFPQCETKLLQPSSFRELSALTTAGGSLIARGLGRSYGDSALASRVASMTGLDLLQSFNPSSGVLCCQAGVSLRTLLEVFVPRGWFIPVTPGTSNVTVGGALASDVHGKNHHLQGCFSNYVDSFRLLIADGSLLTCSRTQHADLFQATCGGMGLTGIIVDAVLRLRPVSSAIIEQKTLKAANLGEALQLFEQHHQATYSVAWIDCLASGDELGRSVLMLGEHAEDESLEIPRRRALSVPFHTPAAFLNRHSVRAFNALYYLKAPEGGEVRKVDCRSFFYPLDNVENWNRLYGRNGFLQYQFVLPREAGLRGMKAILQRIAASGQGSFLAVLKAMGASNQNPLSFPIDGYSLALDFKLSRTVLALLDELDAMVLEYGGRHYLAKDARMSAELFKRSYPQWMSFQEVRERYGAMRIFSSQQSRRLGLD